MTSFKQEHRIKCEAKRALKFRFEMFELKKEEMDTYFN
jgi:hypothetical protein